MPLIIPTNPVPAQVIGVQLSGQDCSINIYSRGPFINGYGFPFSALFCDVSVGGSLIIAGVLCLNLTLIVRSLYLGFLGDLAFLDNQGTTDPQYTGLGIRYSLCYLTAAELTNLPRALYSEES